ncbi:SemiSWEET family sugar transporter [Reyranella massiliensis]|uniref:SemiSWEET family sugar transporter n=1 Tax=Reyranella massiliensis TaxID=445220 RepID=UPI0005C28862|nr:SemiSWEET transporter [Reyranella massiliensis]
MDIDMLIGGAAALLTTASNVPQLKKCWETRSAGDLSLKMLLALASGVALWIAYGGLKADWVIVAANTVSLALVLGILYFRLREP